MHIPDGYLSPQTAGVFYAVMAPLWALASKAVNKTLTSRQVPYLAFGASFIFVIMMFNIPIPGGSTGHAIGGTLVAILLGPWAACLAVTVVLIVQALLFGDGGIMAIGANCFNMAFVLPFAGYYLYRLTGARLPKESRGRAFAAAAASYIALTMAALLTGVEFGVQPLLHHTADGKALYCPYGLSLAVPAMFLEHLLLFGWVEALVTFGVMRYMQKHDPSLIKP